MVEGSRSETSLPTETFWVSDMPKLRCRASHSRPKYCVSTGSSSPYRASMACSWSGVSWLTSTPPAASCRVIGSLGSTCRMTKVTV